MPALAAAPNSNWEQVNAHVEIIDDQVKNLQLENTILGMLVKASKKPFSDLIVKDGKTLLSFAIHYDALVQQTYNQQGQKTITQYGLYRSLDPKIQDEITKNNIVTIRYLKIDPVLIEFLVKNKFFPAPALLTDTIDIYWQPVDAK